MAIHRKVAPRLSHQTIATALLVIASVLMALALFLAGAIWRARVTSGSSTPSGRVLRSLASSVEVLDVVQDTG